MTHRLTQQDYDRAIDLEARDPAIEAARRRLITRVQRHRAEGKLPRTEDARAAVKVPALTLSDLRYLYRMVVVTAVGGRHIEFNRSENQTAFRFGLSSKADRVAKGVRFINITRVSFKLGGAPSKPPVASHDKRIGH